MLIKNNCKLLLASAIDTCYDLGKALHLWLHKLLKPGYRDLSVIKRALKVTFQS